jgi:hypothetical protein
LEEYTLHKTLEIKLEGRSWHNART